jgi:predicted O-linked N-acetylglucosamine transferase (SPINDLY family)
VTTGLSRVDYYVSSALVEIPEGDAHYTEKLYRLPSLPTVQNRLPPQPPTTKAYFGLPEDRPVYLCSQTFLKMQPEQDPLFGEVLRRDSRGILAIKLGPHDHPNEVIKDRMRRSLADVYDRIHFLPWQSKEDFWRLIATADVLLDTHPYGAGSSAYDAFSFDCPLVTLPGRFHIGRYPTACYNQMGIEALIASSPADYGEIAVRTANDPDFRKMVLGQLKEKTEMLFDDPAPIRAYEDFFRKAVAQGRGS